MRYITIILLLSISRITTAQTDSCEPIFHITGETPESSIGSDIGYCADQNGGSADELLLSNSDPNEVWMFYGGAYLDALPDL